MKRAEIKVGESYLTEPSYPTYGARAKVLEIGVERPWRGRTKSDGIRVLVERSSANYLAAKAGTESMVTSRNLVAPWTTEDEQAMNEREARNAQIDALELRVRNVSGVRVYGSELRIDLEHADEFLDRAGVPR